jgi:hypothetical protein
VVAPVNSHNNHYQTVEFVNGLDAEDEELLEEWCGLQGEAGDLDEWE